MRYGLLADVHTNLPALEAVLAALGRLGVDRYVCAGDVVGFGPHPAQCIERVAGLEPAWVLGNHELMLLDRLSTAHASPLARRTLEWTRSVLPSAMMARLGALPETLQLAGGVVVTHASLSGPTRRVREREQIAAELRELDRRHPGSFVLVVGHTHRAMVADHHTARWVGWRRRIALANGVSFVVNPGSVGQSRQYLNFARAAVLDTSAATLQFVAVRYDTSQLRRDLADVGFPSWTHHRSPAHRLAGRLRGKARALLAKRPLRPGHSS